MLKKNVYNERMLNLKPKGYFSMFQELITRGEFLF